MAKEPETQYSPDVKLNQLKRIQVSGCTDRGQHKAINEDSFATFQLQLLPTANESNSQSIYVAVVADGVSEKKGGEIASWIAVETVKASLSQLPMPIHQWLTNTITSAHHSVLSNAQKHPEHKSICSTMIVAVIQDSILYLGYVGDSYVYLLRDGKSYQLTVPHNEEQEHIDRGESGVPLGDRAKAITRYIGNKSNIKVDLEIVNLEEPNFLRLPRQQRHPLQSLPLKPGDTILVCSDGLTKAAKMATILHTVEQLSTEDAVYELIKKANDNGAKDNVTAVLMQYPSAQLSDKASRRYRYHRNSGTSMLIFLGLCLAVLAGFRLFSSWRESNILPKATTQIAILPSFTATPPQVATVTTTQNLLVVSATVETPIASSIILSTLTSISTPTLAPPPPVPTQLPTPSPVFLPEPTNTPKTTAQTELTTQESEQSLNPGTGITESVPLSITNMVSNTQIMSCKLDKLKNGEKLNKEDRVSFSWSCNQALIDKQTFMIRIGPSPEKINCDLYGLEESTQFTKNSSNLGEFPFQYTYPDKIANNYRTIPEDFFTNFGKKSCLNGNKEGYWTLQLVICNDVTDDNCRVNVTSDYFRFEIE